MSAQTLLDIAAEYVEARETVKLAAQVATTPEVDLDEIAQRFEVALDEHLSARV